jgi:hypothetical protein
MSFREELNNHFTKEEVNNYFEELSKISNITKNSYEKSRELIITSNNYLNDDKLMMLKMLDVLYTKTFKRINTSSYDGKVYCQMFFEDFLEFLKEKSFSINEFKVLLAIYTILNECEKFGNALMNLSQKALSEKSGVDITNIGKIIKKLVQKDILKNENKNIYINYNYFWRGSKIDYDDYTKTYSSIISKDHSNK